jgi:RHS repeat-associated protein
VDTLNPTGYAQVVYESIQGPGSNSETRNYTYGLDRISQTRNFSSGATQTSYYVHDGHGSTRALTDTSGNVTDTYDYDAFGNEIHSTGTTPNEFLFAGEQYDSDLHLYYNRARYLNVSTGRFWTMDTYEGNDEDPLSLHKYFYTEGDPVDNTDPCGKCLPSTGNYGNIVQEFIFEDFLEQTGELGFTNKSINAILGKTVPSGGLAPDLIDTVTLSEVDTGQIWEIKSVYSTAAAVAKIALYVSVLNIYGKGTGLKWIPGVTYAPPPIIPINASTVATTSEPFPGVITYCVVNQIELYALAAAADSAALASLSQDFATATLTTALAPVE